jgi:hypothetical protein
MLPAMPVAASPGDGDGAVQDVLDDARAEPELPQGPDQVKAGR